MRLSVAIYWNKRGFSTYEYRMSGKRDVSVIGFSVCVCVFHVCVVTYVYVGVSCSLCVRVFVCACV